MNKGGGYGFRGTCSMGRGETSTASNRWIGDAEIETGNVQVGRWPRAGAGDYRMETGDTYVGEGLHAGTGEGAMMGLGFDAAGEDDEGRIGDRGQGDG